MALTPSSPIELPPIVVVKSPHKAQSPFTAAFTTRTSFRKELQKVALVASTSISVLKIKSYEQGGGAVQQGDGAVDVIVSGY